MSRITGKEAAISGIGCLKYFQIVTTGFEEAEACSAANGAVFRSSSNLDWQLYARGLGHTPPKLPGDKFQFLGTDRLGYGWQSAGVGGGLDAESCIVDRVVIHARVTEPPYWFWYELWASANGSLTKGTYSAPSVGTAAPVSAKDRGITIDASALSEVLDWELELLGNNSAPKWTGSGSGWPYRDQGNIDASLTFGMLVDSGNVPPAMDTNAIYKAYVTADTYWELKWLRVKSEPVVYPIVLDNNSTDYVEATKVKAVYTSYDGSGWGYIKDPDTTSFWAPS